MFPVMFTVMGFPIHTYGVLLAVAFAAALWTAVVLGREACIPADDISDLALAALISGLVGARLLYAAVSWRQFAPMGLGALWQEGGIVFRRDGFVFYGGFLLAVPATIWLIHRRKLDFRRVVDVLAPALALGHAIGRLGCFAQGCCYGAPSRFGLLFPADAPASCEFGQVPVHPTQLYESLGLLVLFGFLLSRRAKRRFEGEIFALYMICYSLLRFLIECLRADDRGFYLGPLSVSQLVSLLVFACGVSLHVLWRKRTVSA